MPRSTARTHKAGIAVRVVALMALLGAFAASFAAPAGAAGTVTVNPNPVSFTTSQTDATVTVTSDGHDHPGTIEHTARGWVHARITIDPELDYGAITPRLAPQTTVCVRDTHIRKTTE